MTSGGGVDDFCIPPRNFVQFQIENNDELDRKLKLHVKCLKQMAHAVSVALFTQVSKNNFLMQLDLVH